MLIEQVRNHLDTEDSVLLTAIEDLIDDDTLMELGRRMEQRDRVIEARRDLAAVIPAAPAAAASPPPSAAWSRSAPPSWPSWSAAAVPHPTQGRRQRRRR